MMTAQQLYDRIFFCLGIYHSQALKEAIEDIIQCALDEHEQDIRHQIKKEQEHERICGQTETQA